MRRFSVNIYLIGSNLKILIFS